MGLMSCLLTLNVAYAQADNATTSEVFSAKRAYEQAKLSPDGKHLSVLGDLEDGQASLMVFELATMELVAVLGTDNQQDILSFWWANNERLVANLELRNISIEYPKLTGELFAFNADNSKKFAVAGFSTDDTADFHFLDSNLSDNEKILVVRSDIRSRRNDEVELSRPIAFNLDIYKRHRKKTGSHVKDGRLSNAFSSPYQTGGFVADNNGQLRLAYYVDKDDNLKISKRDYEAEEWVEFDFSASAALSAQNKTNPVVGFDAENTGVYYLAKSQYETVGLFHLQLATGQINALYEHEQLDIREQDLIYTSDREVVGINPKGTTTAQFFVKAHAEVGRLRGLENAFKGKRVEVLSYSRQGEYALVDVISGGSESGLYLYDGSNNSLSFLMPANT